MGDFIGKLAALITGGPITAGLVLAALLAVLTAATLALLFHRPFPPKKLLLVGLAVGIPIMTPMLVQSQKSAVFAMNLSIADVLCVPVIVYLLLSLLKRNKPIQLPLFWLFTAYVLWAAISIYIGCTKLNLELLRISNLVSLVKVVALFVYFYMVLNLLEDLGDLKVFLKAWIITGTIVGLIGSTGALLYQIYHIENFAAGDFRAMGTLGNPNMFAGYITTTFLFTYIHLVLGGSKWLCIIFMVTHGIAILLSASKGSVAAFLVGAVTLALFLPRHRKKMIALGALAVVVTVVVYSASEDSRVYIDRILSITDLESKSHERRFALWETALKIWIANPLCGVGLGNYSEASPEESALQELGHTKWDAAGLGGEKRELGVSHSTYLSLLSEMGVPGFLLFVAIFLYFVFLLLGRVLPLNASDPSLSIHAAFLAVVTSSMAHAGVANIENARGLWASLGVIFAYELKILRKGSTPSPS